MKKLVFALIFCSVSLFAQYMPLRQSSLTMAAGDSLVTVTPTNILGVEESVVAIGFDANWRTGATKVTFKVYDEVAGSYKTITDSTGTYPIGTKAGASKIVLIKEEYQPFLRNFQILRDSVGTFQDHYGASTILTIYKKPVL